MTKKAKKPAADWNHHFHPRLEALRTHVRGPAREAGLAGNW
jgi:hypothetical protein